MSVSIPVTEPAEVREGDMKIDSTSNVQTLYKGVIENSQKYMQSKEIERTKTALETKQTVSSFVDVKGTQFDAKA